MLIISFVHFIQDEREDCYEAKFTVKDVDLSDQRNYYLAVENERGTDRHAVHLAVKGEYDPLFYAKLV